METISALVSPYARYLPLIGSISAITFVVSLAIVPTLLSRIPANHFIRTQNPTPKIPSIHYPLVWVLRNLAGLVLILAGLAMLILPGQGLLTIVIGIFVADFPGKKSLERKLVANKKVFNAINWIRARKGCLLYTSPSPRDS